MDQLPASFGLDRFVTPATLVFCLGVYAIVLGARRLVEKAVPRYDVANNWYWRELVVPLLPGVVGVAMGAGLKFFPFPTGFEHAGPRMVYGLVCGFLSALVYKVLMSIVRRQWLDGQQPGKPCDETLPPQEP